MNHSTTPVLAAACALAIGTGNAEAQQSVRLLIAKLERAGAL